MHKLILFLTGTFLLVSCSVQSAEQKKGLEGSRPNIILVMTDDQGYPNLSCVGHPVLKTPHIDEIYTQSTRFTSFHVSPTCAPTRSAMMSGRHEFRNGVTHTIHERAVLPRELKKKLPDTLPCITIRSVVMLTANFREVNKF